VNGKKRVRDDREEVRKHISGDEDESRAGAIRQKKKGKANSNANKSSKHPSSLHPPTLLSTASSGRSSRTDESSQTQSSGTEALKPRRPIVHPHSTTSTTKSTTHLTSSSKSREPNVGIQENAHESSSTSRPSSPQTTPRKKKKKKKKKKATSDGNDAHGHIPTLLGLLNPLSSIKSKLHSPSFGKGMAIDRKPPSGKYILRDSNTSEVLILFASRAR
jgi:hypothetical protein